MARTKTGIKVYVLDLTYLEKLNTKCVKLNYKQQGYISEDLKLKVLGTWGYVKTKYGVFMLNCTGNGLLNPVGEHPTHGAAVINLCQFSHGTMQPYTVVECPIILNVIKAARVEEEVNLEDFILRLNPLTEKCFETWYKMFMALENNHEANVPYEDTCEVLEDSYSEEVGGDEGASEEDYQEEYGEDSEEEYAEDTTVAYGDRDNKEKIVGDATLVNKIMLAKNICTKEDVKKYGKFIVKPKCECKTPEVLCNMKENVCSCGISKSHSHCAKCGKSL